VGGGDAGHARPDDGHPEVGVRGDVRLGPPGGPPVAVEGQFLGQHRQVLVSVGAHEVVDQVAQVLALGGRRRHRPRVAVPGQRGGGQVPAPRHLLRGDARLGLQQAGLIRAQVLDQQVVVTGQLGDGDEQGSHVGPLEGGPDRGVIGGERLGGDVEAHAPPASHAGRGRAQEGLDAS